MGRKKNPNKTNEYFGPDVEQAIQDFNKETEQFKKDIIFTKKIYPALNKLCENVINNWKFWRYETTYMDLKSDLIAYLYERLPRIDRAEGKAYSYFTVSARHYCIQKNQLLYKESLRGGEMQEVDEQRNIFSEQDTIEYRESLKEFMALWSEFVMENLEVIFTSKNDRKVAEAIVCIFKSPADVEFFSKKEIYILIREHSKLETQYITRVLQVLKDLFYNTFKIYQQTGTLEGKY